MSAKQRQFIVSISTVGKLILKLWAALTISKGKRFHCFQSLARTLEFKFIDSLSDNESDPAEASCADELMSPREFESRAKTRCQIGVK